MAINSKQSIWVLVKNFPRAVYLFIVIKLAKRLVNFRNRPAKILTYPNKKLRKVSTPIEFLEDKAEQKLVRIVSRMASSLQNTAYGMRLGLAAPQIGINKRVFIVRVKCFRSMIKDVAKEGRNMNIALCISKNIL